MLKIFPQTITESVSDSDRGDCRTAPATPGLLIKKLLCVPKYVEEEPIQNIILPSAFENIIRDVSLKIPIITSSKILAILVLSKALSPYLFSKARLILCSNYIRLINILSFFCWQTYLFNQL